MSSWNRPKGTHKHKPKPPKAKVRLQTSGNVNIQQRHSYRGWRRNGRRSK